MRLIAIQDAIRAAEEGIRILRSEEKTAQRDLREAEEQPAPPVEVEMQVKKIGRGSLQRGYWIAGPGWTVTISSGTQELAQKAGEKWLAALSKQLGVEFVPKWEETEPEASTGATHERPQ